MSDDAYTKVLGACIYLTALEALFHLKRVCKQSNLTDNIPRARRVTLRPYTTYMQ